MAVGKSLGSNPPDGETWGITAADKISFLGATPVAQQAHIADATDAATAITKCNAVIAALETFGLLASS